VGVAFLLTVGVSGVSALGGRGWFSVGLVVLCQEWVPDFFFSSMDIALVFTNEVGWVNVKLNGVNRREFYFVLEIVILVDDIILIFYFKMND
jgi:hypothetical protein